MTSISVIITNYNYGSYVIDAIDSVLAQTRAPGQVIVVDDGSTDGSPERLTARYGGDPRVLVHLGQNGGQLGAFRQGLELATCEVVAFLDADDFWERGYLEEVARVYETQPEIDFVFTDLILFGNEQGREAYCDRPVDIGYTALSTWMTGWWYGEATSALSMRREWADRALDLPAGFLQTWKLSADACLVFGASLQGAHKYFLPTGMVRYRVHGTNGWWHSKDREQRFLRRFRARSLINYYAREMAMDAATEDLIKLEFQSKPDPSHEEARRYAVMALRSAVWWPRRLWRGYSIVRRGTWWERGTRSSAPVARLQGDLRIASPEVATARS